MLLSLQNIKRPSVLAKCLAPKKRRAARGIATLVIISSAYLAIIKSMLLRQHWRNKLPESPWVNARLDERVLILTCVLFLMNLLTLGLLYCGLKSGIGGFHDPAMRGGFIFVTCGFIVISILWSYRRISKITGNTLQAAVYLRMLFALPVFSAGALLATAFFSFYFNVFSYSLIPVNAYDLLSHFIHVICPEGTAWTDDFIARVDRTHKVYHFYNPGDRLEELLVLTAAALQQGAPVSYIQWLLERQMSLFSYILSHMSFGNFVTNFSELIIPIPKTDAANFVYGLNGMHIILYLFRGWLDYITILLSNPESVLSMETVENANEILAFINTTAIFYLNQNAMSPGSLLFASSLTFLTRYTICCVIIYYVLYWNQKLYDKSLTQIEIELSEFKYDQLPAFLNKYCAITGHSGTFVTIAGIDGLTVGLLCISADSAGIIVASTENGATIKLLYGAVNANSFFVVTGAKIEVNEQLFTDYSHGVVLEVHGVSLILRGADHLPVGTLLLIGNSGIAYLSMSFDTTSDAVLLSGAAKRGQRITTCGARMIKRKYSDNAYNA